MNEKSEIKKCEICKEYASNLCLQCMIYYCDACYKFVHDKKENNNHKKEKIDLYVPIDTKCSIHEKYPIDYFCLDEKELCCSNCIVKNIHYSHKILEINDEESLKKENISIESSKKEFNEIFNKIKNIKENLEKEMNEIDKLYDKIYSEVTKAYEIKHEKLIKEENNLKENLQNEVTKVKEKLEEYSTESNRIIKVYERIIKGIEKLEKEEKSMIKILSYVSRMNKNQKKTKNLLTELMRNIKISYIEDETSIKYDDYFFSGIQIPKDLKFKDISNNSFIINWNIDNIDLTNINKSDIKFKVEIRKENNNEKFKKVYEDKEKECFIKDLEENTNYEIRICSFCDDLIGQWCEIQKVKTSQIDSSILRHSDNQKKYLEKIFEWTGYKRMDLLYRGSRDGTTSKIFHEKCDHKGPTICLYENEKGYIFGGFSSISWTSDGNTHEAKNSFIFTLTNIHGIEPTKFINNDSSNVNHHSGRGPCFGNYNDIQVFADYSNSNCVSAFPCNYKDNSGKGKSIFTGDFNNDNSNFRMKDIEVFKVS